MSINLNCIESFCHTLFPLDFFGVLYQMSGDSPEVDTLSEHDVDSMPQSSNGM